MSEEVVRETKEEYLSKFEAGWVAIIKDNIEPCSCGRSWKPKGDYCHSSKCDPNGIMTLGYYK